jgi:hypothetical protein
MPKPKSVYYEGGDDNFNPDAPPKSKNDQKKEKYGGDMDGYSAKDSMPNMPEGGGVV